MTMDALYIICWKSLLTGETGKGTEKINRYRADRIIDYLNKQNKGILKHWKELAKNDPLEDEERDNGR